MKMLPDASTATPTTVPNPADVAGPPSPLFTHPCTSHSSNDTSARRHEPNELMIIIGDEDIPERIYSDTNGQTQNGRCGLSSISIIIETKKGFAACHSSDNTSTRRNQPNSNIVRSIPQRIKSNSERVL
jgi:hypothetical protein